MKHKKKKNSQSLSQKEKEKKKVKKGEKRKGKERGQQKTKEAWKGIVCSSKHSSSYSVKINCSSCSEGHHVWIWCRVCACMLGRGWHNVL